MTRSRMPPRWLSGAAYGRVPLGSVSSAAHARGRLRRERYCTTTVPTMPIPSWKAQK